MTNFSQQIVNFKTYGTYTYEFDEVGNMVFNSSSANFSQNYLALPLDNFVYDNSKILGFYDPTFTEFVSVSQSVLPQENVDLLVVQSQLEAEVAKNTDLINQLNNLILQTETTVGPNQTAIQQVILELRKQLGQGRVDSDFSPDFPYAPIIKTASLTQNSTTTTL